MNDKLIQFANGAKVVLKHLTTFALVGMMAFSSPMDVEAIEPRREIPVLLSQVSELTAPRESHHTNGALRSFLFDFIDTHIEGMQNEDQGELMSGMDIESQRLSDYFMQGYRLAMGEDMASLALGLNDDGMDLFYGSKTVDFFTITNPDDLLGGFNGGSRRASVAINTMYDGTLKGLEPEHIARVILYEIDGRGRGWEPTLIFALTEHFGLGNPHRHGGLFWDPTMEMRVSEAAGGIHTLFEAADNGQDAVRDHMNSNFRNANPYFDFDYDSWQMARAVDYLIRHRAHTPNGQRAAHEFKSMGGGHIQQLQSSVGIALIQALSPEIRRESAERVNKYVAILAEIGMSLENVLQVKLTDNLRLPVVDLNNPDGGIIGQVGHFHSFFPSLFKFPSL